MYLARVHVGVLVFPGAEPVRQSKGFPTGRVNRRVGGSVRATEFPVLSL